MFNWIKTKIVNTGRFIKAKIKWFLVATGLLGTALAYTALTPDPPVIPPDVSFVALEKVEKIGEKFKIKVNEGPTEEMSIEIGGDMADFMPTAKLKKWGDETFLKIKYPTIKKIKPVQKDGKLKWKDQDQEIHMFPVENGFEYDILFKKKPKSNIQTLDIETQGLKFYYQPPLDIEMAGQECWTADCTETDCCDCHRPENVVGSYAVYHESKKNNILYPIDRNEFTQEELNRMVFDETHIGKINEKTGKVDYFKVGKKYKAGKAFHWYRIKAWDTAGTEVWCKLNVDVAKGVRTIEIPQEFLDNAVYPVVVDDTFGYITEGQTQDGFVDSCLGSKYTLSESASASKFTIDNFAYVVRNVQVAIYNSSLGKVATSSTHSVVNTDPDEEDVAISAELDAGDYWLLVGVTGSYAGSNYIRYDAGAENQGCEDSLNSFNWPDTLTPSNYYARQYSIYCTYTAGGGAEEEEEEDYLIIFD